MMEKRDDSYEKMRTPRNLILISIALGLLLIAGIYIFGFYVLLVSIVAIIIAGFVELIFAMIRKLPFDNFWFITPLVMTLLLPPTVPLWIAGVGSFFGYFFGKSIFGGAGKNIFNPALVGILFVTISFPQFLSTSWLDPVTGVVGTQTPLSLLHSGQAFTYSWESLLYGETPGAIGETFRIGIIGLGLILMLVKAIDWKIPLSLLSTVFIVTLIGYYVYPDGFANPFYSLFTGSLMLVAFFVATEPVTSPLSNRSKAIYGIGIGLLVVLIRNFGTFPEGTVFAVILMNAVGALLDSGDIKKAGEVYE